MKICVGTPLPFLLSLECDPVMTIKYFNHVTLPHIPSLTIDGNLKIRREKIIVETEIGPNNGGSVSYCKGPRERRFMPSNWTEVKKYGAGAGGTWCGNDTGVAPT